MSDMGVGQKDALRGFCFYRDLFIKPIASLVELRPNIRGGIHDK